MSIVQDRRVVVTGKIAGESRQTAEAKLREAGAIIQSSVSTDTDLLVTGSAVGATKMNKARALGVDVITWGQAFESTNGSNVRTASEPRAPLPRVRQWDPQLCQSAAKLPAGGYWSYEIKWDGVRGVATVKDGGVSLQSRSGKTDYTERYPEIVEELSHLSNCVLDGELVEMGAELGLLGDDCDPGAVARFIVFDILEEDGQETVGRPLYERREILGVRVPGGCYVARSPVFSDGPVLLDFVIKHGLEGVVSKQTTSKYVEGGRGPTWLKTKVRLEQEFIVLGYTPGEGHREWAFGALILGYSEDGQIKYAGKVGTGFDDQELGKLKALMLPFEVGSSPWDLDLPKDLGGSTWIAPSLVVQVAYQRFTDDGLLWHPSYKRVREDKEPWEVVREA